MRRLDELGITRNCVADRDQDIAEKPVASGTLYRRSGEHLAERRIVEPGMLGETRRRQLRSRQEIRLMRRACEFVPWAYREAIIAAKDAVADQRAQLDRAHPLVLDCQRRDAAPRIELVGSGERRGRAGVEAAAAGAAMVPLRRVGFEFEPEIDLAEEQPGAEIARHQIGVLALPT